MRCTRAYSNQFLFAGPSPSILSQFTLEVCTAAKNHQKITYTFNIKIHLPRSMFIPATVRHVAIAIKSLHWCIPLHGWLCVAVNRHVMLIIFIKLVQLTQIHACNSHTNVSTTYAYSSCVCCSTYSVHSMWFLTCKKRQIIHISFLLNLLLSITYFQFLNFINHSVRSYKFLIQNPFCTSDLAK